MLKRQRIALAMLGAAFTIGTTGCVSAASSSDVANPSLTSEDGDYITTRRYSPLDEYLSLVLGLGLTRDEQISHFRTRNIRQEELVAQCMNNLGFDYTIFVERNPIVLATDLARPLDDLDWVSQWGYGITDPTQNIAGITTSVWREFLENDPNLAVYSNLYQGEQLQWRNALWGEVIEIDDDGFTVSETIGCLDIARQQGEEELPQSIFQSDEFAPLFSAWMQMSFSVYSEVSDADRDWAACMADRGFPRFSRQTDAAQSINETLGEIIATQKNLDWHRAYIDGHDPANTEWSDYAITGVLEYLDYRQPQLDQELVELQTREIDMALADLNCRTEVDFQNRRDAFEIELETQFVNDHRVALVALRDAAEQRGITWQD